MMLIEFTFLDGRLRVMWKLRLFEFCVTATNYIKTVAANWIMFWITLKYVCDGEREILYEKRESEK